MFSRFISHLASPPIIYAKVRRIESIAYRKITYSTPMMMSNSVAMIRGSVMPPSLLPRKASRGRVQQSPWIFSGSGAGVAKLMPK